MDKWTKWTIAKDTTVKMEMDKIDKMDKNNLLKITA